MFPNVLMGPTKRVLQLLCCTGHDRGGGQRGVEHMILLRARMAMKLGRRGHSVPFQDPTVFRFPKSDPAHLPDWFRAEQLLQGHRASGGQNQEWHKVP